MIQGNRITREVAKFAFAFRIHSQKIQFLKFNENPIAQQKRLFYLVINLNYICEKNFVKFLVVLEIQSFKFCCTAAVQR